jgi:hypothetical protein
MRSSSLTRLGPAPARPGQHPQVPATGAPRAARGRGRGLLRQARVPRAASPENGPGSTTSASAAGDNPRSTPLERLKVCQRACHLSCQPQHSLPACMTAKPRHLATSWDWVLTGPPGNRQLAPSPQDRVRKRRTTQATGASTQAGQFETALAALDQEVVDEAERNGHGPSQKCHGSGQEQVGLTCGCGSYATEDMLCYCRAWQWCS